MKDKKLLRAIQSIVGKENVSTSPEERVCYSYDATNIKHLSDIVVHPHKAEEISQIMRLANKHLIPVVPRGAGCGFSGGSVPIRGGISLVTTRMNRILQIDDENLTCMVEPGVVTGELQRTVERRGLFYPPDPSSLEYCTIGGNIAEGAGGPRALKYGVTRDYVLALEVVLPQGEVVYAGSQVMKSVVGYDLSKLFVGSEGTLGIITKITLKLIPLPQIRKTMMVVYPSVEEAATTVSSIIRNKIIPSCLEFMDNSCINSVEDYLKAGLPRQAGAILIIEVDGSPLQTKKEMELISALCQKEGASQLKIAASAQEAEQMWRVRRSLSPAIASIRDSKINEDVVVPRSRIPQLVSHIEQLKRELKVVIPCFGHAGDGNLHLNFMYNKDDQDEAQRIQRALHSVLRKVIELSGSLSGEHGIGFTKAPYISMELDKQTINLMKSIKKIFDPNNILNPGKIFPPDEEE